MKKFIKYALFALLAIAFAITCVACSTEAAPLTKIEGELPEYNYGETAAYGELPDLDNVVIDGRVEDELWQDRMWYSQYTTVNRTGLKFTTAFSEKGLYIATYSIDRSIYWRLRNHFDKNTHIVFRIVTGDNTVAEFRIDANNLRPTSKNVNARSVVNGTVNQMGGATGLSAEMYVTWDELDFDEKPESILIFPFYQYKTSEVGNLYSLYPTFMKDIPSTDDYLVFDDKGYTKGDAEDATIGDHTIGLGKNSSWIVERDEMGNEIVATDAGRYIYPQAIFFKQPISKYFMISARVKVNSASSAVARAGLLIYQDDVNYRSMALEITNDEFSDGKLSTLNVKGYTNYPSNVTVTTQFDQVDNNAGNGRGADEADLMLFFNDGNIYYIVNGEYLHSENLTYINNAYMGLYSVNSDVVFSNLETRNFANASDIDDAISEYAYSVRVENLSGGQANVAIDQIGVAKDGDDGVELTFTCTPGYTVDELYFVDVNGSRVDIYDEAVEKGSNGKFLLSGLDSSITIYCSAKADEAETIDVKLYFYDSLRGIAKGVQKAVSFILTGSGAFTKYNVNKMCDDGIAVVSVPKGYSWSYQTTFSGYRTSKGEIEGGVLNESMAAEQYVEIVAPIVGGTATSEKTGESISSSVGNYWDISGEENGEVVFQTTNNRYSYIFFSGPTMSEYHVAYVEMTNETDPLAFTSLERDPAAGFIVHNQNGDNLAMIRYDGMRLVPKGMGNFGNRTDAGNLIKGYPGYVVNTDGGIMTGDPYISSEGNTVNRLAYNDRVDTTSLLMIRNGSTMYFYIADGSAGVKGDKTNFDKLEYLYKYENATFGGEAAIGIGVTVSYNLRVKFSNYWLLSGAKARAFSDELISSTVNVIGDNYENNITLDSDGMYVDENGKIKIVQGSELNITAKSSVDNVDGKKKVVKLALNNSQVKYISGGQTATYLIPEANKTYGLRYELVDAIEVRGKVKAQNGVNMSAAEGRVYDGDTVVKTFKIAVDGSYSILLPKSKALSLLVTADGFATTRISIPSSQTDYNAGESQFISLPFGGTVKTDIGSDVNTTNGYTYGVNESGVPVATWWSSSTANVINLALRHDPIADAVVKFSYSRRSAAQNGSSAADETDLGIGLIVTDGTANHKLLLMQTGYRLFQTSDVGHTDADNASGKTHVNVRETSVDQIDIMFIKRGSYVYIYSKYAYETNYTLVTLWHALDADAEVLGGKCTFAIAMTSMPGRFIDVDIFNVSVEPLKVSEHPEIISEVTVGAEGGSIAIETTSPGFISKAGNVYTVYKNIPVTVKVTPSEGKVLASVLKNGNRQALSGYSGGVYSFMLEVSGNTTIGAEFLSADDVAIISGTVKDSNGKGLAFYTLTTAEGYSATTDGNGNFANMIAPKADTINFLGESKGDLIALDSMVTKSNDGMFHVVVNRSKLGGTASVGNMTYYSGLNLWDASSARVNDHGYTLTTDEDGNEIALWDNKAAARTDILFSNVSSDKLVARASMTWLHAADAYPVAGFTFRDASGKIDSIGIYGENAGAGTADVRSWSSGWPWPNAPSIEPIPYRHVGNHQGTSLAVSMGKVDMVCVYDNGNFDFYVRFSGANDDKWYHLYNGKSIPGSGISGAVVVGLGETSTGGACTWYWSDYSVEVGQAALDAFYYNNVKVLADPNEVTVEVTGEIAEKKLIVSAKNAGSEIESVTVNGKKVVGIIDENGKFVYDLPRCPEATTFEVNATVVAASRKTERTGKVTVGGRNLEGVTVIFAKDGSAGYKAVTNASGEYTVSLADGNYTVYFSHELALDKVATMTVNGTELATVNMAYGISKMYNDTTVNTRATYYATYDATAEDVFSTLVVEQRSLNAAFTINQPIGPNGTLEFSFKAGEGHSYYNGNYSDLDEYYKWTISEANGANAKNFGINSSGNVWGGTLKKNVFGAMTQAYKDKIYHEYHVSIRRNGTTVDMYAKLNDGEWTLFCTTTVASATNDYYMNLRNDGKAVNVDLNRWFYGFSYTEA